MKAAVVPEGELSKLAEVKDIPKPSINDDQILIKSKAYAINPTDWKHIVYKLSKPGDVIGSDVSGVVEEVGSNVTNFKKVMLSVHSSWEMFPQTQELLQNMLLHTLVELLNMITV